MLRSTIKQCVDLQQGLDNLIRSTEQTYWLSFCFMSCLVIICAWSILCICCNTYWSLA